MRIAITGASGLLGQELLGCAVARGHRAIAGVHVRNVAALDSVQRLELDLLDPASVGRFVASAQPDWIIHSAALTDVDRCETDPQLAERINVEATRHLLDAVRGARIRILFTSTDYVFDGQAGPYSEQDRANPINVYGKTKLRAEGLVSAAGPAHLIVRSASFIGVGGRQRPTFVEGMLETMRDAPPLKAAVDQISNATPVADLAAAVIEMAERGLSGLWHVAHPEILSRYDLASRLAEQAGLPSSVCEPVPYSSLSRPALRPLHGGLRVERMQETISTAFRSLDSALADLVAKTSR